MNNLELSIHTITVLPHAPLQVTYVLFNNKRVSELNIQHFLTKENPFGIITIEDPALMKEFTECVKTFQSIAGGSDLVRLRQFLVTETQRILQERLEKYGEDIFAKEVVL